MPDYSKYFQESAGIDYSRYFQEEVPEEELGLRRFLAPTSYQQWAEDIGRVFPPIEDPNFFEFLQNIGTGAIRFVPGMAALVEQGIKEPVPTAKEFGEFMLRGAAKPIAVAREVPPFRQIGDLAESLTHAVVPEAGKRFLEEGRKRSRALAEESFKGLQETPIEELIELTAPWTIGRGAVKKGQALVEGLRKRPPIAEIPGLESITEPPPIIERPKPKPTEPSIGKLQMEQAELLKRAKAEYPELGKGIEPSIETKPIPKVEAEEPGIIGLNKAEQNRIRADLGLDKLEPVKRKTWERTLSEAKEGKFDDNATSIADEVLKSKRPITDNEHAGMVLKAAKLTDEYTASIKEVSSLIEKGDTKAAQMERMRADAMIDQLDKLTDAARQGRRETARALSIGRMMVSRESYNLVPVMQRARASKGAKLTTSESAKIEKMVEENSTLEAALKEVETKYEKLLADKEIGIAERVTKREARKAGIRQRTATAREKILSDRTNIKNQLAEMGFRVNDVTGLTTEGAYLVGKLATTYIKEGALTLKEVVQKVLIDLPQLSEGDVYSALAARNHKAQVKARIEVNRRVSRLKTQARLLVDIEKAERGVFEPRRPKAKQLPEIKNLQRKLRELRNGAYKADLEAAKLEKAIQTINELQDQLTNQYRNIRNGKAPDAPELAAAKEKIKQLRSHMKVTDELTRLNDQLRTGEFEVRERPVPKQLPPELERAQIELKRKRQEIKSAIYDMAPVTARKVGVEAINTLRTMKATADMSATLRQGLVLSVRRPIKATKAFGKSAKAFFNKYTAEQVDNAIRSADHHYIREKSGLYLAELDTPRLLAREEMFMARVIEKLPVVGEIVKASNRHMVTYLNMMRSAAFDQFYKKYPNATHAELKAWADAVSVFSGRGNLGRASTIGNELSLGVFAPRFAVSRVQTPYMFFKYIKEPRVRTEIAKDLAATAGFGATILTLAELSGLGEVGTDPRDADFGKIRIGDTRIDIWAGMQQPMRLVTRIGIAATDRLGLTGKELSDREKEFGPIEALSRFAAYKLAPSVTVPAELIKGRTVVGEKVTPEQTAIRSAIPMVYESIYEAYRQEGLGRAALAGGLEFFGMGVATYKDSQSRVRRDIRKMLKSDNEDGAYQKMVEWNMENPDKKISTDWFYKVKKELYSLGYKP